MVLSGLHKKGSWISPLRCRRDTMVSTLQSQFMLDFMKFLPEFIEIPPRVSILDFHLNKWFIYKPITAMIDIIASKPSKDIVTTWADFSFILQNENQGESSLISLSSPCRISTNQDHLDQCPSMHLISKPTTPYQSFIPCTFDVMMRVWCPEKYNLSSHLWNIHLNSLCLAWWHMFHHDRYYKLCLLRFLIQSNNQIHACLSWVKSRCILLLGAFTIGHPFCILRYSHWSKLVNRSTHYNVRV